MSTKLAPAAGMNTVAALSGQSVAIPTIFVKMTGNVTAAYLLRQIIFWASKSKHTGGWFWKSADDWNQEIGLSWREIKNTIKGSKTRTGLAEMGIETDLRKPRNGKWQGKAPVTHYRVNWQKLEFYITDFAESEISESEISESEISKLLQNVQNPIYQEITQESTSFSANAQEEKTIKTESRESEDIFVVAESFEEPKPKAKKQKRKPPKSKVSDLPRREPTELEEAVARHFLGYPVAKWKSWKQTRWDKIDERVASCEECDLAADDIKPWKDWYLGEVGFGYALPGGDNMPKWVMRWRDGKQAVTEQFHPDVMAMLAAAQS